VEAFVKAILLIFSLLLGVTAALAQDPKQQLNEQMWEAVRRGDAAEVTALLDKGADVNAKFRYGATALFKAAERGHVEVAKILLARGADVTVKDTFYGATAMTWALDNEHIEIVRLLLEKDASSVEDVLQNGVSEGNVALVEMALAKGGAKPETLTAALASVADDKDKAAIADALKKAGAKPPLELDAAVLGSYVGRYKPEQGNELIFTVKDRKLFAMFGNQGPFAMMAIDKTTFRPVEFGGITITFTVEGDKASGLTMKQGPTTTVFKKQ
jgi:ankyrin repeat protein